MTTWMTRALLAACVLLGGCADEVPVAKPSPPRVTPATTPATKDEQLPADMQSALEEFARLFPQFILPADDQALLDEHHAQRLQALRRHMATLLTKGDARSQLDYAMLSWLAGGGGEDAAAIALRMARANKAIARASAADPDDAMAAWLEAVACSDARLCDKAAARRRLQALEPDNMLVWMLELEAAALSPRQLDAVLARMAASRDLPDIYDRTTLRSFDALQRAGLPEPDARVVRMLETDPFRRGAASSQARQYGEAMTTAGLALPSPFGVSNACRDPMSSERRSACLGVMGRLADSGNLLFEGLATGRMVDLTKGTPAEAQWLERRRQHQWRVAAAPTQMDARILDLRMRMNEVDAFDALQAMLGRPVVPPPGWKPRQ